MPRHTLIKPAKTKHKERILKAAREKATSNIQGKPHTFNSSSFSRNSVSQKGMVGCIYSTEREESTTKITVPSEDLIQNWWRNKKLFRQAKVKRIQYHQTSFTTNIKRIYIVKKYKRRKKKKNQPQTIKKMAIGTYTLMITLNENGLNAPTKRHKLGEWIQKQDSYICCLQETHFRPQDTYKLKVRGWKNIFHANGKQSWNICSHIRQSRP